MIVRVFRCRVHPDKQKQFEPFFRGKAVSNVRAHKGLISIFAGAPMDASSDAYLMVSIWKDLDSLKAFTGENWQKPYIDPAEADLISEVTLEHYEGGHV